MRDMPASATTPPILLADHERAHVFQYMVLGPLFLPMYLAFGGSACATASNARPIATR